MTQTQAAELLHTLWLRRCEYEKAAWRDHNTVTERRYWQGKADGVQLAADIIRRAFDDEAAREVLAMAAHPSLYDQES